MIRILWTVIDLTAPALLLDPSTFRTGRCSLSIRSVNLCRIANSWPMIIPSVPLSTSARALISLPECFPMRDTLSVIDGLLTFRIVPHGIGSESTVSSNTTLHIRGICEVLIDSAAIELSRNPLLRRWRSRVFRSDTVGRGRCAIPSLYRCVLLCSRRVLPLRFQ